MSICLILTGKVQVDIRFLISFKSKESFKWNIKSFFYHLCPAFRTVFIRHVTAGHTTEFFHLRRIKITVFTVRTDIMRRQWIYLCDAGHSRRQGGTNWSTGTNQIAIIIGFPHQLLCNDIHHRISVGNNRIQLFFQPLLYNGRKIFPINLMRFFKTDISEILVRIFNYRRKLIRMNRRNFLYHISDLICICNNDLLSLFASQIRKLLQHLLCGTKIKRCLIICIAESISCHDNPTIDFILWIHKMNITGCHYRFFKLFSKFDNLFIDLNQILFWIDRIIFITGDHKCIISQWLNLKIIIKINQSCNFLIRSIP